MVRLFIALILPDEIKQKLGTLIADLKPRTAAIRWVVSQNMHLTLKFIGERPEEDIEPITAALEEAVLGRGKFEVQIKKCGGFPNLRNPRVLWVGIEGAESAVEIACEINKKLVPLGIEADKRPFSPHLTLGRIKKKIKPNLSPLASYMESLNFDGGSTILDRVALVKSTLTPGGPIYENLEVFELE